jgi:hypothetical protein
MSFLLRDCLVRRDRIGATCTETPHAIPYFSNPIEARLDMQREFLFGSICRLPECRKSYRKNRRAPSPVAAFPRWTSVAVAAFLWLLLPENLALNGNDERAQTDDPKLSLSTWRWPERQLR